MSLISTLPPPSSGTATPLPASSTPPTSASTPTTTPISISTSTSTSTSASTTATSTNTISSASSSSTGTTTSSSSSSSATTQSSSSTSTTTPLPSTTSATPTIAPVTVTSGGVVITTFTTIPVASVSSTPSSSNDTTSTSFFHNTGAVAGVFTVVGLVVVVIFIALVTNVVRRRRAQKFDRDVAEAAAEAAASSRSPFDDYPSGGNGGYPYSDSTHGTFGQTPMGLSNDTYGMSEMSDPYAAGAASLATVGRARSRLDSESRIPGTPGIAGVGAGNLAREPSRRAPYHAFAGPPPQPYEAMDRTASMRYRRGAEMLEAVGLAGTGAAAMATPSGGAYVNRRPSQYTQQTHGSMRSQGHMSNENYHLPIQPGYQPPQRNDSQFADAYTGINDTHNPQSHASPNPYDHSQIQGQDFHDVAPPAPLHNMEEDGRVSYADDDDYGQHKRVLRVANE